jgi:hypothetical protein
MHRFSIDFFRLQRTKYHYFGNTSFASQRMRNEKRENNYNQMKIRKKIDSCIALITGKNPISFHQTEKSDKNIM